ncbi:MAG: disulfide oxidoreductase [Candidatus Aenigmatarchaeota archaeon]
MHMPKVTKDTTLAQALKIKGADDVLTGFRMPCMGCPMAAMEMERLKLGEICDMYGLDLSGILGKLNKLDKTPKTSNVKKK